ncbi:MAG: DUF2219 family protein [Alphaproteobacteria bacterium]|nr:DUF2219 family protein [Alphaproteobacteria bacterium]
MRGLGVGLFFCVALATPPAIAADATDPDANGVVSFIVENDVFTDRDEQYTNGLKLSWLSPERPLLPPGFSDARTMLSEGLGDLFGDDARMRWGIALGQSLYTPNNTKVVIPDPSDRPYAGWLYTALSLVAYTPRRDNRIANLTSAELHLGVVGPSALGEEVQNGFHRRIGVAESRGWDSQLKDEPGVMLLLDSQWHIPLTLSNDFGLELDLSPTASLALGNVQTYAALGGVMRFGQGLDADFGAPRIRPALSGSAFFNSTADWSWYLFAGIEGRAIAQDIFLDGNTWRDSPSVDKKFFVADMQAGLAVILLGTRVTYSYVFRTDEFDGQQRPAEFGAVSFAFTF